MSNRRTLMAAAAIVLALVAGIGVYLYASGADQRAQENASFVDAYVANADIAKGTTGSELLQAGLISKEKVAKGSLPPSLIANLNDLNNLVTAGPISAKQFITAGSFVSAADGTGGPFSTAIAAKDLVAVTVTVDADHGVANQIAPGDHVNIATTTTGADGHPGDLVPDEQREGARGRCEHRAAAVGAIGRSAPTAAHRRRAPRACSPSR